MCNELNDDSNILNDSIDDITSAMVDAMTELPIVARLKFAESLLLGRLGSRVSVPRDMVVVTANEVIRGVIDVLEKHPAAAKLGSPKP